MHFLPILLFLASTATSKAQDGYNASGGNVSRSPDGDSSASASGSKLPQGGQVSDHPASKSVSTASNSDEQSIHLANYLLIALASAVVILLVYRVVVSIAHYIRTLVCLNNDKQRFFTRPNPYFANFKKHVLYAPLFGTRHMREFRPFPWLNMGIIPNRIQTLFIAAVVVMNVTLMVIGIDWKGEQSAVLSDLLKRSGTLAVVNLIPMVLMAGRNNPLISLLGVQYDTFNLMHRWFGRIVVLESITHAVSWLISTFNKSASPFPCSIPFQTY